MAFPGTYNFNYYRGDTNEFVVRPKNSDGSAYDLADYVGSGSYTVANKRGTGATQISAQAVVNGTTDTITCTILPATGRNLTSGTYVYDVQIVDGQDKVFTLLTGTITVTDDITGAV
jgi:hypothetical protein